MSKENERWQEFLHYVVEPYRVNMLFILDIFYQTEKQRLQAEFVQSFRQFCQLVKRQQDELGKGKINYFMYSMLRTEIASGRHRYLIEAMDERWYGDEHPVQMYYDASWAFQFLDKWERILVEKSRPYIGTLPMKPKQLKLKSARLIHAYVVDLIRKAMLEAVQTEEYQALEKEAIFECRVGEYWDWNEIVMKDGQQAFSQETVKDFLKERLDMAYVHSQFADYDLSEGEYENLDFRFSNFQRSHVANSRFTGSVLVGTQWSKSILEQSNFNQCLLYGVDFQDSDLRGAMFQEVLGNSGHMELLKWGLPLSERLNFAGANLEGADFQHAQLRGALFFGANLNDTTFTGADLTGAFFSQSDFDSLALDDEQKHVISWIGGDVD